MGMQSFRGAGGGGAFSTPAARIDSDPFGEYELVPLAQDVLRGVERNSALIVACSSASRPPFGSGSARCSSSGWSS